MRRGLSSIRFMSAVRAIAFAGAMLLALAGAMVIPVSHTDNGRRIFLYGTTAGGQRVENSHGMEGVGCAMCHGADGRGGIMHGIAAPDITFLRLIDAQGHDNQSTDRRHPDFNLEIIKSSVAV